MVVDCAIRAPTMLLYVLSFQMSAALVSAQCSVLNDHGSHVTADIEVGTPGQPFAVIVDTGSDATVVPACECVKVGFCDNASRCFEGNYSSSYAIQAGPYGLPPSIKMVFGSGPVFASVSSEIVRIGGVEAQMQDSLYLINGHALDITSTFEGILGMGLPFAYKLKNSGDEKHQIMLGKGIRKSTLPAELSGFQGVEVTSHASLIQRSRGIRALAPVENKSEIPPAVDIHGLAERAGVQRVSFCLKNQAPGVMDFQPPPPAVWHGSVGRVHWGLDFRGVSVGNDSVPVSFCTDQEVGGNKTTPCGAMLDTGSTSFRAPGAHIGALYAQICDTWPRCAANYTAVVARSDERMFKNPQMAKGLIFKDLLYACKEWWVQGVGLDELPTLYFHVRGAGGTSQTLEIHGWSYVVEQVAEVESEEGQEASTPQTECVPVFRPIEYNTDQNGPVWVLGMPLFYEYQVGFDHAAWPPAISFDDMECSQCPEQSPEANVQAPMSASQSRSQMQAAKETQRLHESKFNGVSSSSRHATVLGGRRPRRIVGNFREPYIDRTMPL